MRLPGLRELLADFDAFFVDLWGVVHDGERPFPGVVEALEALAAGERRVVFLTNTSRTNEAVARTLEAMGIGEGLYTAIVTAGDVTRDALVRRDPAVFVARRARCLHVGNPAFVPWLFEIGLAFTEDARAADVVIATGAVADEAELDRIRTSLAPLAARDRPLVCTNPDRFIPTAGGPRLGPGAIAHAYAALGGRVFAYGKPHPPIYAEARRRLGDVDARRILALGDMVETDVRGAAAAGLASALVLGQGYHAGDAGALDALFAREQIRPRFVLDRLAL